MCDINLWICAAETTDQPFFIVLLHVDGEDFVGERNKNLIIPILISASKSYYYFSTYIMSDSV